MSALSVGLSPERVRALTGRPLAAPPSTGPSDLGKWLDAQAVKTVGRAAVFQVEVTPELAGNWLKLNSKNRRPSRTKIRRFARAMKAGRWILNGEAIKFSANWRLLDGQSRLMAICEAAVPVVLEIRAGLQDAAQESMDTGEARQHRHQLEMLGAKNPNELAAALRLLWIWQQSGILTGEAKVRADITNTTIREALEQHPKICESVGRCMAHKQLLQTSVGAYFHYLFFMANPKKADLFFDRLTTGANIGTTNPIYQLRERLMSDRLADTKISRREKFALIVRAWNAHYLGKTLTRLTYAGSENFPTVAGLPSAEKARAA